MEIMKTRKETIYRFKDVREHRGTCLEFDQGKDCIYFRMQEDYEYLLIDIDNKDIDDMIMALLKIRKNQKS